MTAYYNEFDPFAAQWLRNLIDSGLIAPGIVDDRSISDVTPSDLNGFKQCHFFAGIGGWSLALRLAGVPDDYPCWTGSPPCQPFSTAGKQLGQLDERHLAPTFMRLVTECRPPVLFGEQVAAAIRKHWLDDLFDELEREKYACGAAVLPAASVGAPHKRDRLFFGAVFLEHHGGIGRAAGWNRNNKRNDGQQPFTISQNGSLAESMRTEWNSEWLSGLAEGYQKEGGQEAAESTGCSDTGGVADAKSERPSHRGGGEAFSELIEVSRGGFTSSANPHNGFWSGADWLGCKDGKFRPVEAGTFPLADGIPARVGRLRGYGNAIVPQVAAEFIGAFLDSCEEAL
ncbi:DNA cytosine methyltransferase [Salmonella enterica subsp. enterica serovar Poona]|nr:DNA cytosine methyltransferase [Salmonella enterica]EHM7716046.1 DNA cytosine methyltransferase [Salmonella enterica subsp. enterica serovar Poona]ELD1876463.1 DNA cytosine methyltransferase [Salmonella enterica]